MHDNKDTNPQFTNSSGGKIVATTTFLNFRFQNCVYDDTLLGSTTGDQDLLSNFLSLDLLSSASRRRCCLQDRQ